MDRTTQLVTVLQERGYRITPQRTAICRVLVEVAARGEHPTPYSVYEALQRQFPGISKATVYNTLTVLRNLGELTEIGLGQEETHYESDPEPHANLICLACGRIVDLADDRVTQLSHQLAGAQGFALKSARTDIYGYCRACQAAGKSNS